jgi:hypothetical protein
METKKDIITEINSVNQELLVILDEMMEMEAQSNPDMNYLSFISKAHNSLIEDNDPIYKRLNQLMFFYIHNN